MANRKLGFAYFGGIGDCLRILVLFHGTLLNWINRGRTPVRWNDGGTAGSKLVKQYIISRIPGFYAAGPEEEFAPILDYPRWHRFFRWTRTPMEFRLTPEEEAGLPKLSAAKPNVAICPHHNGLACKKLPADSINKLLALLREKLDAEYYVFDERIDPSTVDAPCIGGLNLTQAMVLTGRFDGAISVDSWQKYIMGMLDKPQTALVVDFRKNELYTHEATPTAVYQEFFRWRVKPEEILGYEAGFSAFTWMNAAQVDPAILAGHFLRQVRGSPRFAGRLLSGS
jgi:hypothetical protein